MPAEWTGRKIVARNANGGSLALTVASRIRGGGEGAVYRDAQRPGYALKMLHTPRQETERKIKAMLRSAPDRVLQQTGEGDVVQIAWPEEALYTPEGHFAGFSEAESDSE